MTVPESLIARYPGQAVSMVAETIIWHRDAQIGADISIRGKYAVYFYRDGEAVRKVGGFATTSEASAAIPLIVAETIVEEIGDYMTNTYPPGENF